jgi:hypothetical protein
MATSGRRALHAWREARQLTPEQLAQAGAGISAELIRQWETSGEPPADALPHLITLARVLEVPLDQLDLGPNRRGFSEGGYSFVLFARGRDDRRWRARIGAWGWPAGSTPPEAITNRAISGVHAGGPTVEDALDALEAELRALVRETLHDAQAMEPPSGEPSPPTGSAP